MKRQRSREIAMELLFGMSISKNDYDETIETFIENYEMDLSSIDLQYIKDAVKAVDENVEKIDEIINEALVNWKLDRLSKVNLSILRLGVAEMIYINDVPEKVAINEAVELAKKYSDDKSVAFINGVLDKAFKDMQ